MHKAFLIGLLGGVAVTGSAMAQEQPDLVGTWRYEIVQAEKDPRCGEQKTIGEMTVRKKITARAYRGNAESVHQSERCGPIGHASSDFTLRIRDNKVSIEYDEEEGWASEDLLLEGDTMTGVDAAGTEMTFVRVVEAEVAEPEVEIDMDKLNEFLESLRPDFTAALRKEYGAKMLQNLRKTGLSREEAMEVAVTTVDRMTDCVLDLVRNDVVAMQLPLETLMRDRTAHVMLQPENVDYRKIECVYDTATNAGVIIH